MSRYRYLLSTLLLFSAWIVLSAKTTRVNLSDLGLRPGNSTTEKFNNAISKALAQVPETDTVIIALTKGTYEFHPSKKISRTLFISNHDQPNPKSIGIILESRSNVTIDGAGSDLNFHGSSMLPIAITNSKNITLTNLHIDFPEPQIGQIEIVANDTISKTIEFRPDKNLKWEIDNGRFCFKADDKTIIPIAGMAFEHDTRHIVYNTSDIVFNNSDIQLIGNDLLKANWDNKKLTPGTIVTLRSYDRPAPAVFVDGSSDIHLTDMYVHYANGMGLLAQNTTDISLNAFNVCLRGDNDSRYFTTQADATHFSGCRGEINSTNGLYEAMMDDAINVHGTYLKLRTINDRRTIICEYMHPQSYGFNWGIPGDSVQILASRTMETISDIMTIADIKPFDMPSDKGAKMFMITLSQDLPDNIDLAEASYGIENLSATPSVVFANNTIRNNRARGALFSTPKKVVAENNLFDHTSGSAILLCGDCNGWFETGACHNVTIRGNRFVNSLTNLFQFTNAIISIYPEIPDLNSQNQYFHSNITITDNVFETFDNPLLYAKSVSGLIFLNNDVIRNNDFPAFHWNKAPVFLEHVDQAKIQ